jgi:hypothetical protein
MFDWLRRTKKEDTLSLDIEADRIANEPDPVVPEKTSFEMLTDQATIDLIAAGRQLLDCCPMFEQGGGEYDTDKNAPVNWIYHRFGFDGMVLYYCVHQPNNTSNSTHEGPPSRSFVVIFNVDTELMVFDSRPDIPFKEFLTENVLGQYRRVICDRAAVVFEETQERLVSSFGLSVAESDESIYTSDSDEETTITSSSIK